MAPFLALYAVWAAWALQLLIQEGTEKFTLIQLVSYAVLALHVSWLASLRCLHRVPPALCSSSCLRLAGAEA